MSHSQVLVRPAIIQASDLIVHRQYLTRQLSAVNRILSHLYHQDGFHYHLVVGSFGSQITVWKKPKYHMQSYHVVHSETCLFFWQPNT